MMKWWRKLKPGTRDITLDMITIHGAIALLIFAMLVLMYTK